MTIKITGTGSALPEKIVTNFDLQELVETSDEWIQKRTGIAQRRISTGETVSVLAAKACERALEMAGKTAAEVDMILVATCSPELLLPCCACQVQDLIGAADAVAFDLNAACSGFLFALNTANAYLQTGVYKNALIVGSEVLSKLVDWKDRGTCILFGDGAGAAVLAAAEGRNFRGVLHSDGSKGAALSCSGKCWKSGEDDTGFMKMDGREIFQFAVKRVPEVIHEVLDLNDCGLDDIDYFVVHQANRRIIESAARRLGVDAEKFPINLQEYGNTSSASKCSNSILIKIKSHR